VARVVVVGDGPGGLSAALFLAKSGLDVTVYGLDRTAVHSAYLHNYLGVPDILGSDFQERARLQVESFGARLVAEQVTAVAPQDDGFSIELAGEGYDRADYVVLSEGRTPTLAEDLGLDRDEAGAVAVDRNQRTSMPRVYAVGRSTRPARSQAIISAGDGATAALDILATEAGTDVKDWDTP
jgi:thioredoxin reductase (NADPH)